MTDTPKPINWNIIVIASLGVFVWYQSRNTPTVEPKPKPTPTIEATVKDVKNENLKQLSKAFSDAATQVENKKFQYARELLEYMQSITKAAREQSNKPFDLMLGQMIPDELVGHEKEVADGLRRIAAAWLK